MVEKEGSKGGERRDIYIYMAAKVAVSWALQFCNLSYMTWRMVKPPCKKQGEAAITITPCHICEDTLNLLLLVKYK